MAASPAFQGVTEIISNDRFDWRHVDLLMTDGPCVLLGESSITLRTIRRHKMLYFVGLEKFPTLPFVAELTAALALLTGGHFLFLSGTSRRI